MKPALVLLDANVIIEAHELGSWQSLVVSFDIAVPSIVSRHEAKYFVIGEQHNPIKLASLIADKKIRELEADLDDLAELMRQFDPLFSESIDAGEQEALALMMANRCPDHRFCSADARPLQALAMLDMSDRGISLEEMFKRIGQTKRLDEHFSRAYLERQIQEGQRRRIQGDGLSPKSKYRI